MSVISSDPHAVRQSDGGGDLVYSGLGRLVPQLGRRSFLGIAFSAVATPALAKLGHVDPGAPAAPWSLEDIFPTTANWDEARKAALTRLAPLKAVQPVDTAASLLDVLERQSDLGRQVERVSVYATLAADADHRDSVAQERLQLANSLSAGLDDAAAWIAPAIGQLGRLEIARFEQAAPELRTRFSHYLDTMLRRQVHILSAKEEALLAGASQPLSSFETIQAQLVSSDIDWPMITLASGTRLRVNGQGLSAAATISDRHDRKQAYDVHYGKLASFTDALGANYLGHVESDAFTAKARHYASSLAMALDTDGTPAGVYTELVATANDGLDQVHRYMALRSRLLMLPNLGYWDLAVPLLSGGPTFTLSDMQRFTLEAVQPLGRDYASLLAASTSRNWMDPFPRPSKQTGGYMEPGVSYDVHPYLLLNLNDDYASLSTYAHEWGHAMHTLLANRAQPYDKAQYTNAISEVPSTLNEILLADMMIARSRSPHDTLIYLGMQINNLWSTYYRQVMLSEFELRVHEKVEAGDGLSGASLSEMYLGLLRKYCGASVSVPDSYGAAWSSIPHFYNSFYVHKYATCIASAAAFAKQVRQGPEKRDRYLDALRAGGSADPYLILRTAGVDLATPAPYVAVNDLMRSLLDRCEALVG